MEGLWQIRLMVNWVVSLVDSDQLYSDLDEPFKAQSKFTRH